MMTLNKLPLIDLECLGKDVLSDLNGDKISFMPIEKASWMLRRFSVIFNEPYFAYKYNIYIPPGHLALATSDDIGDKILANSKLLPWVYAIKNGSVASFISFIYSFLNIETRLYYFCIEYALLRFHQNPEISNTVTTDFLSTRKNILGITKNPNIILNKLKQIGNDKIVKL
jgi:hypothetical protein